MIERQLKTSFAAAVGLAGMLAGAQAQAQQGVSAYYPGKTWARRAPEQVGMNAAKLRAAVDYAKGNPSGMLEAKTAEEQKARQEAGLKTMEPNVKVLGPMKVAKDVNGIILRKGYIVAEFGDTKYVDLTASLSKSILSTVAGVTYEQGKLKNLDEPVGRLVKDGGFDSPHNAKITWRQLLQQTSEWEGTLWGIPDTQDRRTRRKGEPLKEPGAFWDYNDVRVNRLSLSLMRLWQRPLPEVLKQYVMDPIGASDSWQWHGYSNSWVEMNGRRMQSVSGGAHWGGGFWVNAEDLARIGLLYARNGRWKNKQILSPEWIRMATAPTIVNSDPPQTKYNYGFLFWLNADPKTPMAAGASSRAYGMMGGGGYYCWIDPANDLVIVVKNLGGSSKELGEFVNRVTASLDRPVTATLAP